jgi:hypothetical protein
MTSNIVWRHPPFPSPLAREFDAGAYDGIIETIRRQGFLDCLGCDLIPARQIHGTAYEGGILTANRAKQREAREAEQIAAWRRGEADRETAQRYRNLERQRIADEQWKADEAARAEEAVARHRADRLLALGRVRNTPKLAIGSITCKACWHAEQPMWLPPPSYDNTPGYFTHRCTCGAVYQLNSQNLAQECAQLRALAAEPIAA